MSQKTALWAFGTAVLLAVSASVWMLSGPSLASAKEPWSIKAEIAESCSCNPACPCVFGSPPTEEVCEGSRLIEIEKGRFGDVRLDGLSVVATFRMGAWTKYYVSDEATDAQLEAAGRLVSSAFPSFADWGVASTERVPVSVERTEDRVKFSVPASAVDMKLMTGRHGKPVRVQNLPAEFLAGYTQYVSVVNSHDDPEHGFRYSGRNGFTSRLD